MAEPAGEGAVCAGLRGADARAGGGGRGGGKAHAHVEVGATDGKHCLLLLSVNGTDLCHRACCIFPFFFSY